MTPSQDLETFYGLLSELRSRVGGFRYLRDSTSRIIWPERGIYFFFDRDEPRRSGEELRVVRVGTHALRRGTQTTLWGRLHNHRGHEGGGGGQESLAGTGCQGDEASEDARGFCRLCGVREDPRRVIGL